MLFDKTSMFSFKQALGKAAENSVDSKVLDLKLNKGLGDHLKIFAMHTGAPLTAGTVVTTIQSRDTLDDAWTDVGTAKMKGGVLIAADIPEACGRFVRLHYAVGTALSRDVDVWAGLVLDTEVNEALRVQCLNVPDENGKGNTGLEDLDVEGDERNA